MWKLTGLQAAGGPHGVDNRETEQTSSGFSAVMIQEHSYLHHSVMQIWSDLSTRLTIPILSFWWSMSIFPVVHSNTAQCLSRQQFLQHLFIFSLILREHASSMENHPMLRQQHHLGLEITSPAGFSCFASREVCRMWHSITGKPKGPELSCLSFTLYTSDLRYKSGFFHLQRFCVQSPVVWCIHYSEQWKCWCLIFFHI